MLPISTIDLSGLRGGSKTNPNDDQKYYMRQQTQISNYQSVTKLSEWRKAIDDAQGRMSFILFYTIFSGLSWCRTKKDVQSSYHKGLFMPRRYYPAPSPGLCQSFFALFEPTFAITYRFCF